MKSPSQNSPLPSMKKQRSASPSQAMPRSAPVDLHPLDDHPPVLLQQRVGLVVGELAVGLEVHLLEIEAESVQDRPHHRSAHPVAAVDDDLHRLHVGRVDEREGVGAELVPDVDLFEGAAARRRGRGRLRSRAARRRSRHRRRGRARPRGPASPLCRPSGCGRRSPSRRRPARASRPGGRASRWRPCRHRAPWRPRRSGRRAAPRPSPARSGACRGRARPAARSAACRAAVPAPGRRRGRSRARSSRPSARRRARGCRRP